MTARPPTRRALAGVVVALMCGSVLIATTQMPASASSASASSHATPSAATPTVSGPVTGGAGAPSLAIGTFPLSSVGYTESEYLISGTATAYQNVGPLGSDGKWKVTPSATAPYTSRVVVLRPTQAKKLSGNVIVEWLNVSSGQDSPADWALAHDEMIRNGDIYVGVSAQAVGVNTLKLVDPARYGTLSHPGDSYSYDIFSQAGMAARAGLPSLTGRPIKALVASGESQSAFRLTTYVNAVAPVVNVFDSYMLHSRAGGSSALSQAPLPTDASQAPLPDIPAPLVVLTRTDLKTPVLTFQTETDLLVLGYLPARQPDSPSFRLWEVAGTAHADAYVLQVSAADNNTPAADAELFALMKNPPSSISIGGFTAQCTAGFNTGQQHYVFQAALQKLLQWTRTGKAPASHPRLAVNPATATAPASFQVDALGNVLGGIRSPAVDAPVATLSGLPPAGAPGFCVLFGTTVPLTAQQLAARYPSYAAFAKEWRASILCNLAAGVLLPVDAARLSALV